MHIGYAPLDVDTEAARATPEASSAAEATATARIGLGGQPAFFSLILDRSTAASTSSSSAATSSHFLAISSSLAAKNELGAVFPSRLQLADKRLHSSGSICIWEQLR
jgi:hypothetical protein